MRGNRQSGFTILETLFAVSILLVLAGFALPSFENIMHSSRLQESTVDFAGVIQRARIQAIEDNRYYSIYVLPSNGSTVKTAYVDIYPQAINGPSGTGGTSVAANDPQASIPAEVVEQPKSSAPDTATLQGLYLPANTPLTPLDGNSGASPITFGPDGMPCSPINVAGGTVCNSRGTATAYWTFFQNTTTGVWAAVTVTPAGRIQRWTHTGNTWNKN